jgi:predicted RNA polymerase sigma factor
VTDWRAVRRLVPEVLGALVRRHGHFDAWEGVAPNPMATLNGAVALAMVQGPAAGLAVLDTLSTDDGIAASHHLLSVRAHLLVSQTAVLTVALTRVV